MSGHFCIANPCPLCSPQPAAASLPFHVYRLGWQPGSLVWKVDGVVTKTGAHVPSGSETPKLLPCPFCGGPARVVTDNEDEFTRVLCAGKCDAILDGGSHAEAVEAWNRRAAPAAPHVGDPKTWNLVLNEYQRNNLLLLLNACGYPYGNPHVVEGLPSFDTGDWLGEVTNMLGGTLEPGAQTNTTAQRWRDEIRAAASAAAAVPQVVDRDGVRAEAFEETEGRLRAACLIEEEGDQECRWCRVDILNGHQSDCAVSVMATLLDTANAIRALKAPPPPAAAPRETPATGETLDAELAAVRESGNLAAVESFYGEIQPHLWEWRRNIIGDVILCARLLAVFRGPRPFSSTPSAPPPTGEPLTGPCTCNAQPQLTALCFVCGRRWRPPTGERTAAEAEADVMAYLRKCSAAFAHENSMEFAIESIERGDHIGSSRSPAGTGK